ncbi:hypothetical protein M422DRAFT_249606 [Sphaerobolus stellatus SS14]|uniref:Unplaced genomic scaffold SPHSTscaffold_30, whole genome shotgun sequence n=1 Tax=Sphaerobolus stellatus (strain SS14) TaxID=990650 RepID=A0A0C9W539_SPHS4|nr:hypothetical protein M422DRAFT_249606 [Sphaerobolus stellatus SS14]
MFTSKSLFVLSAFLATTNAAPSSLDARKSARFFLDRRVIDILFTKYHVQDDSVSIQLCTDANFGGTCINAAVLSDQCFDLNNALADLNKAISSAVIQGGDLCTFFE